MQDIAGCTGVWFNLHHFLQPRHSSISSIDSGFSTCSRTGRMPRFELRLPCALLLFIPRPSVFLLWCAQQNQRDNAAHMGHGSSGSSPWHLRTAQSVDPMGIYHSKSLLEALPTLLRQAVFQWSSRELPFWADNDFDWWRSWLCLASSRQPEELGHL